MYVCMYAHWNIKLRGHIQLISMVVSTHSTNNLYSNISSTLCHYNRHRFKAVVSILLGAGFHTVQSSLFVPIRQRQQSSCLCACLAVRRPAHNMKLTHTHTHTHTRTYHNARGLTVCMSSWLSVGMLRNVRHN